MNQKWLFVFYIFNFIMNNAGSIIILNGTSSAGKSSIFQELKKIFIQDSVFLSLDDVYHDLVHQEALELGLIDQQMTESEQYKIITHNIDKIFITLAPKRLKAIQQFYLTAKALSFQYHYVILDTMFYILENQDLEFFMQETQKIDTFFVLVYCSPDIIAQRIVTRNNTMHDKQTRRIIPNLNHFCRLYTPTIKSEQITMNLTKTEIENMLNIVQNYLLENYMNQTSVLEKITELRTYFYQTFFDNAQNMVIITPQFTNDIMINTNNLSSEQCAQSIYKNFFIKKSFMKH